MDLESNFSFHSSLRKIIHLHFSLTLAEFEKEGVYPGQPPLLFSLYKHDGLSQKELASKLKLKPATVTVMIKRLEKSGFLLKKVDKKDQRVSRIYLTEKGTDVCKNLKTIIDGIDKICLKDFSNDQIDILNNLFEKITNNLEEHETNK